MKKAKSKTKAKAKGKTKSSSRAQTKTKTAAKGRGKATKARGKSLAAAKSKPKKKTSAKTMATGKSKRKTKSKASKRGKITAIPKGYRTITPYLILKDASAAIDFYKEAFGAKEIMRMETPYGTIGHAELTIGDSKIMLADEMPEMNARSPKSIGGSPVGIHLYMENVDAVIQRAVDAGAQIEKPVSDMFYGDRIGSIIDPFGHKWSVATHIEDVKPAEMKRRAANMSKYTQPELKEATSSL